MCRRGGSSKVIWPGGLVAALLTLAVSSNALAAPAGTTLLVSRPTGLGPVPRAFDNDSQAPAVSANGRYVAFESQADGFAPGVDPFAQNIFLRDTAKNTTVLVSRSDGPSGAGGNAESSAPVIAIAPAGVMPSPPAGVPHVLVTFASEATNLVDHATGQTYNGGLGLAWMRDVTAGTTTLISRADGPTGAAVQDANPNAAAPIGVSPGGPVVAFPEPGGLYIRTVNASATELVSCQGADCSGTPTAVQAFDPALRVAGGYVYVAFDTADKTLSGDPAGHSQVMLARGAEPGHSGDPTGTFGNFELMSQGPGSARGNGNSNDPSIDSDGEDVAFRSQATNLTLDTLPPSNPFEAFSRSRVSGNLTLLSRATGAAGTAANGDVFAVSLGGDDAHLRAAFGADATNLGSHSTQDQSYLRNLPTKTTSLLNRGAGKNGALGNGYATDPAMAAAGTAVAFASLSGNLGDGGGARFERVHLRKLPPDPNALAGGVQLISRPSGTSPFQSRTDQSFIPDAGATSANGRCVAFQSQSSSLAAGVDPLRQYVYVRDLLTNTTTLVSRASGAHGALPNSDSFFEDGISADCRRVAFSSIATNLSPDARNGKIQAYVRDLVKHTTTLVSRASGAHGAPAAKGAFLTAMSADGNVVLLQSTSPLDPAGAGSIFHFYARNLKSDKTTLVDRDNGLNGAVETGHVSGRAAIDANGNRVAWSSDSALAGAPADGFDHVFVRDIRAGTTTLASRADGAAGASAAGESQNLAIDGHGDVVAFSSSAQNLGQTFSNRQIFVRNLASNHTEFAGDLASPNVDEPSLDAAGDRVAFAAEVGSTGTVEMFVRDLGSGTLTLGSRANGVHGAPANGDSFGSLDPTGDCLAFASTSTNLADGFASADFPAIHLRVLRGQCPLRPVLGGLRVEPQQFGQGHRAAAHFTLSEPSPVTLRFYELISGRRAGKRCLARRTHGQRCTIAKLRAKRKVNGTAGHNSVPFGQELAPGRYRLTATPLTGRPVAVTFSVS